MNSRQQHKRWRETNWVQWKLSHIKARAKEVGLDFNLTKEDMTLPEVCPVLGLKLTYGTASHNDNSCASIDRIRNDGGYTADNIVIVSKRVNSIKRDATIEELIMIAEFYKQLQGERNEK